MKLVLLPGLDGTAELYAPLLRCLTPEVPVEVVRYPADEDVGLEQAAELAVRAAGDAPWVLFAESYSGLVAAEVVARSPGGLLGVVLCASFLRSPLPPVRAALARLAAPLAMRVTPPRAVVRAWLTGPHSEDELVESVRAAVASVAPAVLVARLRRCLDADVAEAVSGSSLPVLYLSGGPEDRLVGDAGRDQWLRVRPDAEVRDLHGPHLLAQASPWKVAVETLLFSASLCRDRGDEVDAALLEIASLRCACEAYGGILQDVGVEDGAFDAAAAVLGGGPFADAPADVRERLLLGGVRKLACRMLTEYGTSGGLSEASRAAVERALGSSALDGRPRLRDLLRAGLVSESALEAAMPDLHHEG